MLQNNCLLIGDRKNNHKNVRNPPKNARTANKKWLQPIILGHIFVQTALHRHLKVSLHFLLTSFAYSYSGLMQHIVITGTQEEPESKKDNEPAMELALTKRSQDSYGLADVLRTWLTRWQVAWKQYKGISLKWSEWSSSKQSNDKTT